MTEFAICSLEALCGNIYVKGGKAKSISGSISSTTKTFPSNTTKKVSVFDNDQNINGKKPPMATHHVDHMVLRNLEAAKPLGSDGVYFIYCYDPVYSNPNWEENVRILKDTSVIPHYVASVTAFSEAASLADIILPDTTYLERWDFETNSSYANVKEYFFRQPIITPLGEAKNTLDFLGKELNGVLGHGVDFSMEEYVKAAMNESADIIAKAGTMSGSDWMIANGGFTKGDGAKYNHHEDDKGTDAALIAAGYVLDTYSDKTATGGGTWWDPKVKAGTYDSGTSKWTIGGKEYERHADGDGTIQEVGTTTKVAGLYLTANKDNFSSYKAQRISGKNYAGFIPDKLNKSGLFEVKSHVMTNKIPSGLTKGGLPEWIAIPEHQNLASNEFILTTYKVAVQIHSRSQNCKYLSERYHENFALMHPETASVIGVADGDNVKIMNAGKTATDFFGTSITQALPTTSLAITNGITIKAKVSYGVKPGVIAVSHHCGHTHYGRYATANQQKNPLIADATQAAHVTANDKDAALVWWTSNGAHPNRIIPNSTELFGGMQRWMDTVVTAAKA
jgi:anaerobic selenocysteine-containing dehydrogenase